MSSRASAVRAGLVYVFVGVVVPGVARGQTATYSDQTGAAGVSSVHSFDPASPPQVMASGGAAGDFDGDGWQDLFVLGGYGGAARDRLFINNRNGTFVERGVQWGVGRSHRGLGIAVGDINNDGRLDVYVTTEAALEGTAQNALYRNNGDGTFTDIATSAGVALAPGSTQFGGGWGAALGDYDLDGDLDLAIGDWLNPTTGNVLYRNNGNSTFTNVTPTAIGTELEGSQGFSPRFADMDGDRYPELLWTSDFGGSKYLRNNGNGTFAEVTEAAGVGLDDNGMGTAVGDFNGDGRPDWFVSSIFSPVPTPTEPGTGNMLYMNQGSHVFSEASQSAGVKQGGWGWGAIAADLDHDGRLDLAHTNGWPSAEYADDQTCVFKNTGTTGGPAVFSQMAPACGVTHTGQGRGMVNLDFDNDGDQDLVVFTNDGPLTLYRNDLSGPGTNWLRVFLDTRATPGLAPNGYGAHVIATVNGVAQHRWLTGGSNFLSQSELSVHFGLGSAAAVTVLRIEWSNGTATERVNVAGNRTLTIGSCLADFNLSGSVSVQDVFDFLGAYFGGGPDADVNGSGGVSVQDVFDFLSAYFGGCA